MWLPAQDQTARKWQVWDRNGCSFPALGSAASPRVLERPEAPPSRSLQSHPGQGPSGPSGEVGGGAEEGRALSRLGGRGGPGRWPEGGTGSGGDRRGLH